MSGGHCIGYVGGLAVALGVGGALWLGTPTASADSSSPSTHSVSSGTAKSARVPQRTNTLASMKPAPVRKVALPTSAATLLMAASASDDTRRTTGQVVRSATPSQAAAPTAAATIPIDSSHNLVIDTKSDSSGGSTTRFSVRDSVTGAQIGSTVTLSGIGGGATFTADRDRVMVTSAVDFPVTPYSVQVAVIDTATGTQVGTTLVLPGRGTGRLELGDDNRVLFTTEVYAVSGSDSTHVSLIDSANGTQIGTTLVLDGRSSQGPMLDATGDHAVITTSSDFSSVKYPDQVAVFDTHTGTQTGTTLNFAGYVRVPVIGDDGHLVISNNQYDATTGATTQFVVVSVATGAVVGTPITLDGSPSSIPPVSVAGSNLLVMAVDQDLWAGSSTVNVAVLNGTSGTLVGQPLSLDGTPFGNPIVNDDGVHALLVASISGATHLAVLDTVTGVQSGDTLDLQGAAGYVLPAADGVHVLITADDGESTHIAVVDATTGEQSGTTLTLAGKVAGPVINADGIHALFTASTGDATQVVVVDSTSGKQTGTAADLGGAMSAVIPDAGHTHVLVVTTAGGSTRFTSFDSATGQQTGVPLTFTGELSGWPGPSTAADGTHALFILDDAGKTRLVLIDITTGTQTGTGLTLPGEPGIPILSDDGAHTTIVTRIAATAAHGSGTRVAVIDTTTGNQVGVTTRLTGTPAILPQLAADGHHVAIRTFAGLSANLNTTTGTAITRIAGPPWGLDLEAFALTPLGRIVTGIQVAAATAYLVAVQFVLFGFLWLASIASHVPSNQAAAVTPPG